MDSHEFSASTSVRVTPADVTSENGAAMSMRRAGTLQGSAHRYFRILRHGKAETPPLTETVKKNG